MNRLLRYSIVLLLLVAALPALAQNDRTELTGDYSVIAPEDWEQDEWDFRGMLFTWNESNIVFYAPSEISSLVSPSA